MVAAIGTEHVRRRRRSCLIAVSSALVLAGLSCLPDESTFVGTAHRSSPGSYQRISPRLRSEGSAQSVSVLEREGVSEDIGESAELLQAQADVDVKLRAAEARLKRATAFKLPEAEALLIEVQSLQLEAKELADQLAKISKPVAAEGEKEPEKKEKAQDVKSDDQGTPIKLSDRLSWEKIEAMSNEERFALSQEVGPAFGLSVAIVAVCYWSITLPILLNAYHDSTGEWPRVEEIFSLSDGGKAAGAVAGILGLAALLKPLRIAAAIALTPWTADNVLPLFPWLSQSGKKEDRGQRHAKSLRRVLLLPLARTELERLKVTVFRLQCLRTIFQHIQQYAECCPPFSLPVATGRSDVRSLRHISG
ncbi:unnamed protein product [Symbiodinium sp. CCMP2592]|nr:unnamed protein product [Symbiodinium sp. CCMP2592]